MSDEVQYLLDTTIVSDLARDPQGACGTRIGVLGEEHIATSIVVAAELHFGLAKKPLNSTGGTFHPLWVSWLFGEELAI